MSRATMNTAKVATAFKFARVARARSSVRTTLCQQPRRQREWARRLFL